MNNKSKVKSQLPETQETPITSKVDQNIDAISAMVKKEEMAINRYQRGIERLLAHISSPTFLALAIALITMWMSVNICLKASGHHPWDAPPFPWMQNALTLAAFLFTTVVLITQHRQAQMAERRSHLDLQLNMLVEQKVAKVIQLLEEIRKDSPYLKDRRDKEAEEMQGSTDPALVAAGIQSRLMSPDDPNVQIGGGEFPG